MSLDDKMSDTLDRWCLSFEQQITERYTSICSRIAPIRISADPLSPGLQRISALLRQLLKTTLSAYLIDGVPKVAMRPKVTSA
jgi:hypothetical protein